MTSAYMLDPADPLFTEIGAAFVQVLFLCLPPCMKHLLFTEIGAAFMQVCMLLAALHAASSSAQTLARQRKQCTIKVPLQDLDARS